jgi:hypothetical protein
MTELAQKFEKNISKKKIIVLTIMCFTMTVFLWLDRNYHFLHLPEGFSKSKYPVMEVMATLLTILLFLSIFKVSKPLQIIATVIAIPLIPVFIIGILSQTKPFARLTLPILVLPLIILLSTYAYNLLFFLNLGENFNNKVIPYLNLSTILVLFGYFDLYFMKLFAKTIPENQMPTIVKEWTYELFDKKIFLKISYLLLTILIIFTTVERLYGETIVNILVNYKQISLEALITFVAIDRLIGKWKTK